MSGKGIRIEGLMKRYGEGDTAVEALKGVDMQVAPGEVVGLIGPSGSGKSTLLNLVGGMDRPTAGSVWHHRTELSALSDDALTDYRRQTVGFIFQFYNLVPTLTAYENVQVATELVDNPLDPGAALELVDLAQRADHFPAQLSGGEQQRVAIARALAKRPELLLADEPTGALDLNRDQKLTVVLITHNPAIARIADRVVRLVSGRVAESRINEQPIPAEEVTW